MTRPSTSSPYPAFQRDLAAFGAFWDDLAGSAPFRGLVADLMGCTVPCAETTEAYIIELPLPGFKRENITLEVAHEAADGVELIVCAVRNERKLERTIAVGDHSHPVEATAITSRLEDGVLTITCPKRAASKPRFIPVT